MEACILQRSESPQAGAANRIMTARQRFPTKGKPWSGAGDARMQAVRLLGELERGRKTLDVLLEEMDHSSAHEDSRDRDLFNALVFGVLRWRGRIDYLIAHFSKIPLKKLDPLVLNILRTGLFQLLHLTRIPPSAAVHTAVGMAKTGGSPWTAGFVNAVLRKAAAEHTKVPFPDMDSNPVQALAATRSFPEWLVQKWIQRYGAATTVMLCDAVNTIPSLTLRVNTIKAGRAGLMAALRSATEQVEAAVSAPEGIHVSGLQGRLTDLAEFRQGWFQVQDEAAQLVSLLLDPQPGERVLDACAGRGGKTGHLAQLMQNRGELTAMDKSGGRLAQLQAELRRLGISNATVCERDLEDPAPEDWRESFDRILVDAPCSGLGTLRRNPDIKWATGRRDLRRYRTTQLRLLKQSSDYLKAGGVLVYAVCTPEPEETVEVVQAFLASHPTYHVDRRPQIPEPIRSLLDPDGFLQTYPHRRYMDGFFAVRLRRAI
jgi:16S rRNA (cytosine967-C5)-methyltransferase